MMKLYGPDKREMMQISALERDGSVLVVKGKIFGTMPMTARLNPEDVRAALKMLTPKLILFLITLPFRRRVAKAPARA
jgi:hypothetical protein